MQLVDASFNFNGEKELTAGLTASYEVSCTNCGVTLHGPVHIIARTTNLNPLEESWTHAKPTLAASFNFLAKLSAKYQKEFEKDMMSGTGTECIFPACLGTSIAGVRAQIGVVLGVAIKAALEADAEAKFTYDRKVTIGGEVKVHGLFPFSRGKIHKDVKGFKPEAMVVTSADGKEAEAPRIEVNINAKASATIIPSLKVGLFVGIDGKVTNDVLQLGLDGGGE